MRQPISVKQNLYSVNIGTYKARMTRKTDQSQTPSRARRAAGRAAPARPVRSRRARANEETPYHHGALRDALLQAAERVLERDGLAGLTLRAVAREAGVSHAAPTHHFGDLAGLAPAKAYVAYAQAHPGMYGLMFRTERLDYSRPSLHEAAEASFAGLAGAVGANRQEEIAKDKLTLDQAAAIARAWSLVHGFTMLLLDNRLSDILERAPKGTTVETLLEAMLKATIMGKPQGS